MDCSSIQDRLPAAVLGELEFEERRAVYRHLADCANCLQEEMSLQESMRLLRLQDEEEAPALDIHSAVMMRVSSETEKQTTVRTPVERQTRRFSDRFSRTLLTAAATALFVVGLQMVLEGWRFGEGPPSPADMKSVDDRHRLDRATDHYLKGTVFEPERDRSFERLRQQRRILRDSLLSDIQS